MGGLAFVMWSRISVQPATVVLANEITVRVVVPANDEATRICLHPESLFLSLSRLGSVCRTCQGTEVFVVRGERFDVLHERFFCWR